MKGVHVWCYVKGVAEGKLVKYDKRAFPIAAGKNGIWKKGLNPH